MWLSATSFPKISVPASPVVGEEGVFKRFFPGDLKHKVCMKSQESCKIFVLGNLHVHADRA